MTEDLRVMRREITNRGTGPKKVGFWTPKVAS
jgi:hypothetical protein